MISKCNFCHNQYSSKSTKRKYCSHKCSSNARIGVKFSELHKKRISESLKGHSVTEDVRKKFTEYSRNKTPWNKGKRNIQQSGENHWNWKGGVTYEYKKILGRVDYLSERQKSLERDNYTCVDCGEKEDLQCHHIEPYRISKSHDMKNLRTLCGKCHRKQEKTFRYNEKRDPYYVRRELFL